MIAVFKIFIARDNLWAKKWRGRKQPLEID
jgi:hypothetical protein